MRERDGRRKSGEVGKKSKGVLCSLQNQQRKPPKLVTQIRRYQWPHVQILRKPYGNRQTCSSDLSIWGRDRKEVEQLVGDEWKEEVDEESEGIAGRIYDRFSGNFLFKSWFALSRFVLREIDVSGDRPEMQGVAVEDYHLRRFRGSMFQQVFPWLVSLGRTCEPVLTLSFRGGTNAFKQREWNHRIALGTIDV